MIRLRPLLACLATALLAACSDAATVAPPASAPSSPFVGADPARVATAITDTAASRSRAPKVHSVQPLPPTANAGGYRTAASSNARLVHCLRRESASASAVIGSSGGIVAIGNNALIVPPGALHTPVLITATVVEGDAAALRFAPHGLTFARPAGLVIDAAGCDLPAGTAPTIVYLDDTGHEIERLASFYSPSWKAVAAPVSHFSIYAIAF